MRNLLLLSGILFISLTSQSPIFAQSSKAALDFGDIRQWRVHAVTLSDDGQWYTTRYRLFDEADAVKDTLAEQKATKSFEAHNQTDVLYIASAEEGIQYKVPDGSKPVFSSKSDWIAYKIIKSNGAGKDAKAKKDTNYIELRHLASGFTVQYESDAGYQFLEDQDYFITTDKNSLLIYDLTQRSAHYIGDIGEYLTDKDAPFIAYTIKTEDKRGNGIYLYYPEKRTTQTIATGNFIYSNLSLNAGKDQLAAYSYTQKENEVDHTSLKLIIMDGINDESTTITEFAAQEISGTPENMAPAVKSMKNANAITWSAAGDRLFLKIKAYEPKAEPKDTSDAEPPGESSVQVWHWKDQKLLSERIMDHDAKKEEVFDAVFFRASNRLLQLTDETIQELFFSKGTDSWAIGTDNRQYISDWDVEKRDLYRINLNTGDKKKIAEKHSSSWYKPGFEIAPDGQKAVLWDGSHYWCYDFEQDSKINISEGLALSFIDKEYDQFGYSPDYGFVGWVQKPNGVIVEHKHDLWLLPVDGSSKAQNLTASAKKDSIRFRFEDFSFEDETEIEDRYIDLSEPNILHAFHTRTKWAGYYNLQKGRLTELIYKPASFSSPWRRFEVIRSKHSDAIIYKMGDYHNFPEAYLSTLDFKSSKRITHTNPQQEQFHWGKRILIDYTNDDGVPLQAILSIPDGYQKGQKRPMIVNSYEKMSYGRYRYAMPYLNGAVGPEMLYVSQGYLFLRPDIHFNVGSPHSDMHECIDAAIERVIALGYVDEARIGYEGFSFGGHCGMYISTQKNRFAAIAAGAGVSNLVQGFNIDIVRNGSNEQDYYMTGQGRLGTDPTSGTAMYIAESPVFNAQGMETPLLLFHGTDDRVVQWEHSFGFYSILRYLKKPVVFLSYRGEGHGFRKEHNRLDIQKRLKTFFDHYLKDGEAQKWMTEELPYTPSDDDMSKGVLPKWK